MSVTLVIDAVCRARAEELGVDAGDYRLWEAGWGNAGVDAAIKREALAKAAAEAAAKAPK